MVNSVLIALVLDSAFSHFEDLFIVSVLIVVMYRLLVYFYIFLKFADTNMF